MAHNFHLPRIPDIPVDLVPQYANPPLRVSQPEPDLPENIRKDIDTLSTLCTVTLHSMRQLNLSQDGANRTEICDQLKKIEESCEDLGRRLLGKDERQKKAAEERLVESRISDLLRDVIVEGLEIDGRLSSDDDTTKNPLTVSPAFLRYVCKAYRPLYYPPSLKEVWRRVGEDDRLLMSLLEKLKEWFQPHMDKTLSKPQDGLLGSCLEFISNIANHDNKGLDRLRQLNTTRVLTPYLKSADHNWYAAIALSAIVTEDEVQAGLVTAIYDAVPRLDYKTTKHLVKNDAIRQYLVENGAVGRLIECVRQARDEKDKDGYADGLLCLLLRAGPDALPESYGHELCQLALARRYYIAEYDTVSEPLASLLWNDATRQYLIQNGFVHQLMDRIRQADNEQEKGGYADALLYLLSEAGPDVLPEGYGQELCQLALAPRNYNAQYQGVREPLYSLMENDATRQYLIQNGFMRQLLDRVRQASNEEGYADGLLYLLSQAGPDVLPEGYGQELCQLALARRYYNIEEYYDGVTEPLASLLWNDATTQYLIQNGFVRQLMDRVRQADDEEDKEDYADGLLYLLSQAGPDAIPEGCGQEVCQLAAQRYYRQWRWGEVRELMNYLLHNDTTRQYLIQNGFVRQLMDRVRQADNENEKEGYAAALRRLLSEAERDVIPESDVRDLFQLVLETQYCHGWVHILLKNNAARQCLIQNGAVRQLMDGVRQADDNEDRNKWLRVLKRLVLKAGRDGITEKDALDLVRFVVYEFVSRAWDDNDDDDDDNNDDDEDDDSDNSIYSNLKALISRLRPNESNLKRQEIARILGSGDGGDANARCGKRRMTHWSRDSSLDENECSESEGSLAKIRKHEATIQQLQKELARVKGPQSSSGETEDTDEENVQAAPKAGVYSQKRAEKYGMVQLVSGHQVYLYPSELKIALNDSRIERDLEAGKGRSKGKRSSKSDRSQCKYEQAQHASQNTYTDGCRLARKLLVVFFTREQRMVGSISEEPKPPLKQLNKTVTDAILALCREQDATTTKTKVRNAMASTLTELQYRIKNKRPADQ